MVNYLFDIIVFVVSVAPRTPYACPTHTIIIVAPSLRE